MLMRTLRFSRITFASAFAKKYALHICSFSCFHFVKIVRFSELIIKPVYSFFHNNKICDWQYFFQSLSTDLRHDHFLQNYQYFTFTIMIFLCTFCMIVVLAIHHRKHISPSPFFNFILSFFIFFYAKKQLHLSIGIPVAFF